MSQRREGTENGFLRQALCCIAILLGCLTLLSPSVGQVVGSQDRARIKDSSRIQQMCAAVLLYTAANDDVLPVYLQNRTGCYPLQPTNCNHTIEWMYNIAPYLSSWSVTRAPDANSSATISIQTYHVGYMYNYGYLGTKCLPNDARSMALGCTATDPGSPGAGTWFVALGRSSVTTPYSKVLLVTGGTSDYKGGGWFVASAANPPDAFNSDKLFYGASQSGWGKDCTNLHSVAGGISRTNRWSTWDGFAPKYSGRGHVAMVDGHVEFLSPEALAVGTNFDENQSCTLTHVTDPTAYKWDPRH